MEKGIEDKAKKETEDQAKKETENQAKKETTELADSEKAIKKLDDTITTLNNRILAINLQKKIDKLEADLEALTPKPEPKPEPEPETPTED